MSAMTTFYNNFIVDINLKLHIDRMISGLVGLVLFLFVVFNIYTLLYQGVFSIKLRNTLCGWGKGGGSNPLHSSEGYFGILKNRKTNHNKTKCIHFLEILSF